jgi:hypothetical protein
MFRCELRVKFRFTFCHTFQAGLLCGEDCRCRDCGNVAKRKRGNTMDLFGEDDKGYASDLSEPQKKKKKKQKKEKQKKKKKKKKKKKNTIEDPEVSKSILPLSFN